MSDTLWTKLERLLIGRSAAMVCLRADIIRLAPTALPVLIEGQTGTGKELVAEAIHLASARRGPLVAFNVCAIPDSMFEDALFGHVRGAFTGALEEAAGYLAEADNGTILLDEINGLSLTAQAKLLRVIETRSFRPVGARRDRASDFRILAAANTDLADAVATGSFRQDLFYRLSGLTIRVPTLRHRASDIEELVRHFLAVDHSHHDAIPSEVADELRRHHWPGNVRELRLAVARMCLAAGTNPLTGDIARLAMSFVKVGQSHITQFDPRHELAALLAEAHWDTSKVAVRLGVHRATIYRRMRRYGLSEAFGHRPRSLLK